MQEVIILIGIPGSGKSTYTKALMEANPFKYKRVNNDALREAFDFSVYSRANEKALSLIRNSLTKQFLEQGYSVIIDNVNANAQNFKDIIKICNSLNLDITVKEKIIYIDFNEAVKRDSLRVGKAQVGRLAIAKFWKSLGKESLKDREERSIIFNKSPIKKLEKFDNLPNCIISDLDGTLSIFNQKDQHCPLDAHFRSPYHAETCDKDSVHPNLLALIKSCDCEIFFLTGREEKYREKTKIFLDKLNLRYKLFMKPNDSSIKDYKFKIDTYEQEIKGKYNVLAVFEDRDRCVKAFRQNGLFTCQVAEGDF
jgi:predicted kinase